MTKSLPRSLVEARANLSFQYPFFSVLMYTKLKLELTERIPTLAVDRSTMYINMEYFEALDRRTRVAALAHEIAHAVMRHPSRIFSYHRNGIRGEKFDQLRYNYAADYVVNAMLKECGLTLDPHWLYDPKITSASLTEDVYFLIKPPPGQGQGQGQGQGGKPCPQGQPGQGQPQPGQGQGQPEPGQGYTLHGDEIDPEGVPDEHVPDESQPGDELEWKSAVAGAAQAAKAQGKLPGALERFVKQALEPKKDWREVLRDFIVKRSGFDARDFGRINVHKARTTSVVIPRRRSDRLPQAAIVIDTSGSISGDEFRLFLGAVEEIFSQCRPRELVVVQCDSRVTDTSRLEAVEDLSGLKMRGGGGTDMEAAFRWLVSEGDDPAVCIVLTDGHTPFRKAPPFPVVWVSTSLPVEKFPYGDAVLMEP